MLAFNELAVTLDEAAIAKKAGASNSAQEMRQNLMPVLKEVFQQAKYTIHSRYLLREDATRAVKQMSSLMDELLRVLHHFAGQWWKNDSALAILAVGGYGRSELFPFSDIDLLLLYDNTQNEPAKEHIEWILYGLWDLGLSVGHAVRTIADTLMHAKQDTTICTNLLDARLVAGKKDIYDHFFSEFRAYVEGHSPIDFVERKLAERDNRHHRCGDSRYVLEPNIKEGKGGLRDLQTLLWLTNYIYQINEPDALVGMSILSKEECTAFKKSQEFLWRVRMHVHLVAGRAEERLTFDMQRAVAKVMGFNDESNLLAVERFMKQYYLVARTVGNLTRSVCAVLEENKKRKPKDDVITRLEESLELGDFCLEGERLAVEDESAFEANPVLLVTLFKVSHEQQVDIHPRTLQWVGRNLWRIDSGLRRDDEANEAFMDILLSRHNPENTLRRMNDAGVLGKFIPDFGKVIGQMQFDMYHVYTVDEHTITAIGILHHVEEGSYKDEMPAISNVFPLIKERRVLYLSLFAHDIAKGRGGDHSVLGEVVVRKLGRRFGLSDHETETCAWLVRYHLLMSRTAFKRDTNDPKTVEDFVAQVQTPERLRLLLALTVADIRAVGPTVWNGWKGTLLRDLYYRSQDYMGASEVVERREDAVEVRHQLEKLLPDWTAAELDEYLREGHSSFWQGCDAETHAQAARMLREIKESGKPVLMHTHSNQFKAITDVLICVPDQQGIFSRISGAMALAGANILGAKIFTLKNGMAVELFHIQDGNGEAFDKKDKLTRLEAYVNKAVKGELDMARELKAQRNTYPSRMDVFKVAPRVLVENKVSAQYTVIEVVGRDRIGFLHAVTKAIADLGLTIGTAHVITYGERAVDVFYVKDMAGHKVTQERNLQQITQVLGTMLEAV